ncbi:MAG: hypothetical protein RJA70_525 [Pseudomonadota bacterium]|jgi:oxygen-dependent protoporphyrinogen oxidase
MTRSLIVIGAGVSGLAAAHRALELDPERRVHVLEASPRVGGLIRTERITHESAGTFLVEQGPDSIISEKPAALRLAERLGLSDQVLSTNSADRGAFVVYEGSLERIPEGFSMMAPSQALPILRSRILTPRGKLRLLSELFIPKGKISPDDDVDTASFVERRFGKEVLERLAAPLMGGIYGTRLSELSLKSTMPRFLDLEREHRSVTWGLLKKRRQAARSERPGLGNDPSSSVRYGLFFSFKDGVQTLTDALAAQLGDRIRTRCAVQTVQRTELGYRVVLPSGESLDAAHLICALPARAMAPLLGSVDGDLASELASIPYGSTATVAFGWPRAAVPHALDAFGFVVPDRENRRIIASTWASKKFQGRAPGDYVLLRAFVGAGESAALNAETDGPLIDLARSELRELLGVTARPLFASVSRQLNAMPKYIVGHSARVARIEALLEKAPGLRIAGNSLYGVGIPDAIAAGERAAEALR